MTTNLTTEAQLLAAHVTTPETARWFALGAHLLANGYEIENYEVDYFYASNDTTNCVYVDVDVDSGRAEWCYEWLANEGEDDEDKVVDEGPADCWQEAVGWLMGLLVGMQP